MIKGALLGILLVLFLGIVVWQSGEYTITKAENLTPSAISSAPAPLFNEALVQAVYQKVRPAVVRVEIYEEQGFVASGTGFLVGKQGKDVGHIVINDHLIHNRRPREITVTFPDSTSAPARILGRSYHDLALLRVDSEAIAHIQPLSLGSSSKVQPGQMAVTLGNPTAVDTTLHGTLSVGIVSEVGRSLPLNGRTLRGLIQTDASTAAGTSGGPLLSKTGEVIGIVTAREALPSTGTNVQLGSPRNALINSRGNREFFVARTNPEATSGIRISGTSILYPSFFTESKKFLLSLE